jgi:CheY-like chemotaxis protein
VRFFCSRGQEQSETFELLLRKSYTNHTMSEQLLNILLVDDDDIDIMTLQRAFKRNSIQNPLYIAHNGIEAFDLLRGTNDVEKILPSPRIILLDLNMPQMNGLEFLRELRKDPDHKSASVFVLSTSNDDKDRMEAYNLNVAGYIIKPVTFENFVVAVAQLNGFWKICAYPQ